jgi:hypothetical protein
LQAAGHEVYALTLTGLGERSHLATPEVGLDRGREVGLGWVREGGAGDGCAVRGPRGYAVRRSVLAS